MKALIQRVTSASVTVDKVLVKKTGEPTYRLPDMAYHKTKFDRGFDLCVDVFVFVYLYLYSLLYSTRAL